MFQALLKTAQSKPIQKSQSQGNSQVRPLRQKNEVEDDGWGTPSNNLYSNNQPDQESETPGFLDRVSKLSRRIQIANKDFGSAIQYEQGEKSSEVLQVNELMDEERGQQIPSKVKDRRSTVTRLNYLRMRNAVSEMRQAHFDLAQYLEDERRLMEDFHEKMCMDIEDFFNEYRQKLTVSSKAGEVDNLKRQNSMLRQRMERKQGELQKISKDLENAKSALQQKVRQSSLKEELQGKGSISSMNENKHAELEEQLRRSEQQIEKLLIENQRLQEYIFDIEQQVAGIDLEVERRVRQKMLLLPQIPTQTTNNNAQLQKLREEVQHWENKCKKLQQSARKQGESARLLQQTSRKSIELDLKQQKLDKREVELRNYELNIIEAEKKVEQQKQANYQRERQILQAEDNLNKKINELRIKETDLSRLEAELTWKANEAKNVPSSKAHIQIEENTYRLDQPTRRVNEQNYRIKEPAYEVNQPSYKPNYLQQAINSREMSIKSFGKSPQQDYPQAEFEQKLSPRMKTYQHEYEHKNYHEPRGEYYQNRYDTRRRAEVRPQIENQYLHKNRQPHHNPARKVGLTGSNYRDNREASPYQNVTQLRGRPLHNVGVGLNAGHYRELSKSSRHSAAKSIKSGYTPVALPSKNQGQLLGLGNKLQRLRQEIKKEIESIK